MSRRQLKPTTALPTLLLAGLLLIPGCATLCGEIEDDEPMDLAIDDYVPGPKTAKITNGAGTVLYEGDVSGGFQGRPNYEDLDGTLTIETTWADGETTTQTIEHEPNQRVRIDTDRSSKTFSVSTSPPGPISVNVEGGVGRLDGPRSGFGTRVSYMDASERFIQQSDDSLSGPWLRGDLAIQTSLFKYDASDGLRFMLGGIYFDGDSDSDASVMTGGDSFAFSYQDLMSPGGATGVNFGATGGTSSTSTDFEQYRVHVGVECPWRVCETTTLTPRVQLFHRSTSLDVMNTLRSSTFVDSFMSTDQYVDEDHLGVTLGCDVRHDVSDDVFLFAGLGLDLFDRDADLRSRQRVFVPVNPNPADRDFTSTYTAEDGGFSWSANAEVGVGVRLSHQAELRAGLRYEYFDELGFANNPSSPSDAPISFGTDSADQWVFALGLGFTF